MEKGEVKRIIVNISRRNQFTEEDLKAWLVNAVKFTVPALAVFFGQLAAGVPLKAAFGVALIALWGLLADFFKKWQSQNLY